MRRDQVIDDPPMFPFQDGEGRSRHGRQFRRCFSVVAGQGVHHHVSHAGSKLDTEVKADELAGPLVLRDGRRRWSRRNFRLK
jgi:hypothetical protein